MEGSSVSNFDVFARREFRGRTEAGEDFRVTLSIGTPHRSESGYTCEYLVTGILSSRPKMAYGKDSLEVVEKAIREGYIELLEWSLSARFSLHREPDGQAFQPGEVMSRVERALKAWLEGRYAEAYDLALPLAHEDVVPAQYIVACLKIYGKAFDKELQSLEDPIGGIAWLTKAAERGHPSACDNLADFYYGGWPVEKNEELGAHYRALALEYGFCFAGPVATDNKAPK